VYGKLLTFQLTAADVYGDATGPVEVQYGPAGFSVNAAGLVTWTPSGPLFDRSTPMAWQVRLHNSPQVTLGGVITVQDSTRQYPLARSTDAIPQDSAGIDVEDFDGTGTQSILVGSQSSLYIMAKSGSDYPQTWMYPYDPGGGASTVAGGDVSYRAVTSGDVDGDGHREIFFSQGPFLIELDGVNRREIARYGDAGLGSSPAGPYCTSLKYADVDNDGKPEIVCLGMSSQLYGSTTYIYVLDARTLALKWQSSALNGGTSMAVGMVDTSGDPAIVTSDGFVYDGVTHQNKWAYGPGFGTQIDIGDVYGDGVGKIVGISSSSQSGQVYSAVSKSLLWSTPGNGGMGSIKVANLDGVAPAELIIGDGQWGNVSIYRYNATTQTPQLVSQLNSGGYGATGLAVGDVDGDGQKEIIWESGEGDSAADNFSIAGWTPTFAIKWQGPSGAVLDGPFVGAKLATIASGTSRLMFASPRTNAADGERVIALDPASGAFTMSSEVDSNWSSDRAFDVGRPYAGGIDSELIGTATLYTGYLTAYDFASSTQQYTSQSVGDFRAIVHADLNHDGYDDAIGVTAGGYIYAYDMHNQALLWSSTELAAGIDIKVYDLDGDGDPEIIALVQNGVDIFKHDTVNGGYVLKASYAIQGNALLVADTDGDGSPEIFVLATSFQGPGTVTHLSNTLALLNQYTVPLANSLFLEQSAFARKNLVVGQAPLNFETAGSLLVVDPSSGTPIWASPSLQGAIPINSLSFVDTNGDGQLEIAFGTDSTMYLTR
jgi:hypothetical protein